MLADQFQRVEAADGVHGAGPHIAVVAFQRQAPGQRRAAHHVHCLVHHVLRRLHAEVLHRHRVDDGSVVTVVHVDQLLGNLPLVGPAGVEGDVHFGGQELVAPGSSSPDA